VRYSNRTIIQPILPATAKHQLTPCANSSGTVQGAAATSSVLDSAHVGDIVGALGTIKQNDTGRRTSWWRRLRTLLAIMGPGLIVMVGDNDAGGVATYAGAGQNYGMKLVWTLALLIPVLYVDQEMVVRLGAVSGVGHARLIFERFGKFWGAFSVGDLFLVNALTIVTEFIGVSLALSYFGIPSTSRCRWRRSCCSQSWPEGPSAAGSVSCSL
jgi:hypothetical protein